MARERREREHFCPFCGRTLVDVYIHDDGRDWMGHQRGTPRSEHEPAYCSCEIGRLEKDKLVLTPMCRNCVFFSGTSCKNEKQLGEIREKSERFNINVSFLPVKDPDDYCEYHETDIEIFRSIFKVKEDEKADDSF